MGLMAALDRGNIAVDACILIYHFEEHPVYAPLLMPLFRETAAGTRHLITSIVSLLEIGVGPLRNRRIGLWRRYERALTASREITLVPVGLPVLRSAAMIRARHPRVKTPDALQLASAMVTGCKVFLTNDRGIPSLPGLRVLQLADFT